MPVPLPPPRPPPPGLRARVSVSSRRSCVCLCLLCPHQYVCSPSPQKSRRSHVHRHSLAPRTSRRCTPRGRCCCCSCCSWCCGRRLQEGRHKLHSCRIEARLARPLPAVAAVASLSRSRRRPARMLPRRRRCLVRVVAPLRLLQCCRPPSGRLCSRRLLPLQQRRPAAGRARRRASGRAVGHRSNRGRGRRLGLRRRNLRRSLGPVLRLLPRRRGGGDVDSSQGSRHSLRPGCSLSALAASLSSRLGSLRRGCRRGRPLLPWPAAPAAAGRCCRSSCRRAALRGGRQALRPGHGAPSGGCSGGRAAAPRPPLHRRRVTAARPVRMVVTRPSRLASSARATPRSGSRLGGSTAPAAAPRSASLTPLLLRRPPSRPVAVVRHRRRRHRRVGEHVTQAGNGGG